MLHLRAWRTLMRFFFLKKCHRNKAYLKRKSTKNNQDECRKKRYILVQWISLLGFNNNNTHTHTHTHIQPICGDFLQFEHGQIFSPPKMGSFILSFIQVRVDSTFLSIVGDHAAEMASNNEHWGCEWNAAHVYTGAQAQTKAPAHQQHSVDLLIFSNMVPAEAQ